MKKNFIYIILIFTLLQCSRTTNRVIMIGDSITAFIKRHRDISGEFLSWQKSLGRSIKNVSIKNTAVAGWTTINVLRNLDRIINFKKKKSIALILIGINDLIRSDISIEKIAINIKKICLMLKQNGIKPVLQTVMPILLDNLSGKGNIEKLNKLIKIIAQKNSIELLDTYNLFLNTKGKPNSKYYTDGVHLSRLGYSKWILLLRDFLRNKFKND